MKNIKFELAGLFVSNGKGRHITRVRDYNELIFVKSGVLHIREADHPFEVKAGQFLILHKGVEHGGTADYEKDLSFFWGHFTCPESFLKTCLSYGTSPRPEFFAQYFTLLVNEQKFPNNQRTCDLLMEILLNETCRITSNELARFNGSISELAESAKRTVDLHFADNISTADVAAELKCSPNYLGKVFHKAYGCTILQYINSIRCQQAAYLLRSSNSSVKEIAFFSGFNNLPHFRHLFFRKYSVTPKQYRRLHRVSNSNTMNT